MSGGNGTGQDRGAVAPAFWTRDRVAEALAACADGALPRGAARLGMVATDTRTLGRGALFVALVGDRFDGHAFVAEAVARGAAAVVVSRPEAAAHAGVPVYVVRDTLDALGALARYRRRAWGGPLISVTGSNGKTTTKELLRSALDARLEVHATTGNLNNLIGVPLTILGIPDHTDVAVIEMGINVPGEMARLRAIAEPTIAVMTCIAEEHLEGLGSLDGVMREESLVFDGASIAIVPAAQPEVAQAARGRVRRVVTAGVDAGDVRAERWGVEADGRGFLEIDGCVVRPPVRGAHNLRNAMLAIAAARECGVPTEDAARGIGAAVIPAMRMGWEQLGSATLINDAYNASPASMRAALDLVGGLDPARQRVAILGSMRELGAHAGALHEAIARHAIAAPLDVIAATGEMAAALRAVAPGDPRVVLAEDIEPLWSRLEPKLQRDAIVLLKASRGVQLERLVPILSAWATR